MKTRGEAVERLGPALIGPFRPVEEGPEARVLTTAALKVGALEREAEATWPGTRVGAEIRTLPRTDITATTMRQRRITRSRVLPTGMRRLEEQMTFLKQASVTSMRSTEPLEDPRTREIRTTNTGVGTNGEEIAFATLGERETTAGGL